MPPFEYVRADDTAAAVALVSADPEAEYLAGGTTELDLVLKDGVLAPARLVAPLKNENNHVISGLDVG